MRHKRIITISVAALMLVSVCAACAATSVTAYKDSTGAPMNGLDSGTAVCSWGAGRLDVFAKGADGNLWHKWFDGTWHDWENLGAPLSGSLYSAPTAVSWGAGRIDVFVCDVVLWHKWFDIRSNGWHDWESLGAPAGGVGRQMDTSPAACSWGANRLDIFVTGDDNQLWQLWFNGNWQAWVPLGTPSSTKLYDSPGAVSTVSWGYPRIDIFVRGGDGALWQKWWGNGWQVWHRFDDTAGLVAEWPGLTTSPQGSTYYGEFDYAPAVCSWGANRLDVFFVDMSGHLQQKWFNGAWQPLYQVGGDKYISAGPSAVTWQLGGTTRIDTFVRGDNFALWQKWWAGGWSGWYNLGPLFYTILYAPTATNK